MAVPHPFTTDQKITDFLSAHAFTLSAEVIPPRNGAEYGAILTQIDALVGAGAQFLSVTKGAGGSLRGGSLPIAQAIKDRFQVPVIAHFTCRDLTPAEVENSLIDHHYFGVRNILALRGDPPVGQTQWVAREGSYSYAHELITQIAALNRGQYLDRVGGGPTLAAPAQATDFCIGAAAYPEHPIEEERSRFFALKVAAGAQYGITDMLFDADLYARFVDEITRAGARVPILPGTRILKTRKAARRISERFRVTVPEAILRSLPEDETSASPEAQLSAGLEAFHILADRLRHVGAPGVHLYVITDTTAATHGIRSLMSRRG